MMQAVEDAGDLLEHLGAQPATVLGRAGMQQAPGNPVDCLTPAHAVPLSPCQSLLRPLLHYGGSSGMGGGRRVGERRQW